MESQPKPTVAIYAPQLKFVIPFIKREMPSFEIVDNDSLPALAEADFGVVLLPHREPLPDNIPTGTTVLMCMNTVGTGMTGLPMDLAQGVGSGRYFHILGNKAKVSVVHATDVARAVALSLGDGGRFFISDGEDPTFHDLAEALAIRLNNKRILTLKPWQAKWLMPASMRKMVTTDDTADCSVFASKFDFHPTPVTIYLSTHIYDESSL